MEVKIRQEKESDHKAVFNLIVQAFKNEELSDHKEQYLVERLRKSDAFIPELSIIAEINNTVVGHILTSKVKIKNPSNVFESLALAPVSVLPEFHGKGIGGKLINETHRVAKKLGFQSIILLGHETYYPRFGYTRADKFGIKFPFEVPPENCMAIELVEEGLKNVSGTVRYPKEFNL